MGLDAIECKPTYRPATPQTINELRLVLELRQRIDSLLGGGSIRSFDLTGKKLPGVVGIQLFESKRWPTPTGTAALLGKIDANYFVGVGNMCLTLHGTYPMVDKIDPEGLFNLKGLNCSVTMKATEGSLNPRVARLEFGIFLVDRISLAVGLG
ncbi:hypothetical protein A3J19_00905 [Candidatus Daviesbacteria bacterium RIFCSPLOWO2_02_FULL_41_8]|uniref:Uncharacterized protein n=2 Tax=Candidatus Daviesiibacteriota TaxID=1752718 RepID=A0A1F5NIY9_9BACT|nr:MAG: hypothetical protein A2871_02355 [Candidatus Daviesbacteria bacterium RIFCSPHIGHO2_01_FULL_41_23]OGE77588.1 MAG: hypothetical protein A3J19_00905 [Candidatus Daviesbacteria bacterium RIFCSPLOWO2_02_FULL_41_8]